MGKQHMHTRKKYDSCQNNDKHRARVHRPKPNHVFRFYVLFFFFYYHYYYYYYSFFFVSFFFFLFFFLCLCGPTMAT